MKVLQIPAIGREGRFGNWMVHYLAGRCIAEASGAVVETPNWIGESLFKIHDRRIIHPARLVVPKRPMELVGFGFPRFKWSGSIALPPFFDLPHWLIDPYFKRDTVQSVFQWRQQQFLGVPRVKCAIHIRRGDFQRAGFPVVSLLTLLRETEYYGFKESEVEIVSEESPHKGCLQNELEFLQDFLILMLAENAFVYPRSTFSQMAALMGSGNIYMPYDYTAGKTNCRFKPANPYYEVIFPTKNNSLI